MYFLAGTAASGAMDLISSLTQTLSKAKSDVKNETAKALSSFDVAGNPATTAAATDGTSARPPMTPGTMNALLSAQGQQSGGNSLSSQLFSLLDGDGDGKVSKTEFEKVFAQNGDTTKADNLFAKLDKNGDGSVSPTEITSALRGRHHHHRGLGAMGGPSGPDGASDGTSKDKTSGTSQTVTNADGSITTTITYSDGTQVSMIQPASGTANNFLERMIQRQAQTLGASTAGQSVAVTA